MYASVVRYHFVVVFAAFSCTGSRWLCPVSISTTSARVILSSVACIDEMIDRCCGAVLELGARVCDKLPAFNPRNRQTIHGIMDTWTTVY